MPINPFFNHTTSAAEQKLLDDLVTESITINGVPVFYLPRVNRDSDSIYGEDHLSCFPVAVQTNAYVESFDSYGGDGVLLSKFNLEIRDQIRLSFSQRTFRNEVSPITNYPVPKEGDLLWMPMDKRLYVINYVDKKQIFYTLGTLPAFSIVAEMFEYSGETFSTGVPDIDYIELANSPVLQAQALLSSYGGFILDHEGNALIYDMTGAKVPSRNPEYTFNDNPVIQEESDEIVDFTERNPLNYFSKY